MIPRLCLFAVVVTSFGLPSAYARSSDDATVTFTNQVVRIFQEKCQTCHRPGDIAPMSLVTYQEARPWAKSIRQVVAEKTMPPWHADAEPGTFTNDKSLSEEEIRTIVEWVTSGAPEGDPADLPPARQFDHGGWKAGPPDLVYSFPEPYTLPAEVKDEYRCFVIPTGLDEDVWIQGIEFKPGNPEVVHHLIAFADPTDGSLKKDQASPEPGFLCGMASGGWGLRMLGGWAPGNAPLLTHAGVASPLEKGTTIVYQVHYHNTTEEDQPDRSSMAIYLARETVRQTVRAMPVAAWQLNIPAGDPNVEHTAQWVAPADLSIQAIMPHMHFLGKDMTTTAVYPDGREEVLLDVPRYNFDWQNMYHYVEPVQIPQGTVIQMVSHHDNSADNPRNPFSPPQDIHYGEATDEEMAIALVVYTLDSENLGIQPTLPPSSRSKKNEAAASTSSGGR